MLFAGRISIPALCRSELEWSDRRVKRRTTKKGLKDSQWLLADALRLYFERPRGGEAEKREKICRSLVEVALMLLIDFRVQLDPSWLNARRELKKLNLSSVSVDNPKLIAGYGETRWLEASGNDEVEVSEPIKLKVNLRESGKRRIEYSILIGRGNECREIKGALKVGA
jgi:hypothetical protein